jgi:GTP:adenosylcobinamide-phosphate guanylyltransferase
MDAIITAGGIPQPGEPLYEYSKGLSKAMLDVAGKPMVQWVLDALCGAQTVEHVVMVGLGPESNLQCPKLAAYLPNEGSMLGNIKSGLSKVLEINPASEYLLIVSSDIPTITAEMVDWVTDAAMQTQDDVYYNVIQREVMEARFPGSKRTYTHLKGMDVCGGDMNVMRTSVSGDDELWNKIIASRKNVLKQASLIGWWTLILLMLRQIDLQSAVKRVAKRIHLTGRAIVCPYAEVGMDVDKPHQLEIVRADLEQRVAPA